MARKTIVPLSLDVETDRDILRWLQGLPKGKRSEAVRAAIRDHLDRGGVTLGDIYQAVKGLERRMQAGSFTARSVPDRGDEDWEEPPEAAAALDALAAR